MDSDSSSSNNIPPQRKKNPEKSKFFRNKDWKVQDDSDADSFEDDDANGHRNGGYTQFVAKQVT